MRVEDIKINQLIHVEFENKDHSYMRLPSRVEEVYGNYFVISMPMKQGSLIPLQVGQEITIVVNSKFGLFSAQTRILARHREPIPTLVVARPSEFVSMGQRRDYVRLEINLPVQFALPALSGAGDELNYQEGTTCDISAGGILLITRVPLNPGQMIHLRFDLEEGEFIDCPGRVIRSMKDSLWGKNFGAGVEFINLANGQKDKIFRFVFSKQREWLQKGLL
ncbi:MAG TPA: flagellar brake domain-containing protein [Syntrophomonadaceae bacterium]|nr:flagellar brake domain-containing protein [Syntrophomonadaceae bacterium]